MNVYLAGYNLDADLIEELKKTHPPREDITPETISAAYARISRDPRPVNVLREVARQEVEKSRKSNELIIFGLGHSSVAEHAVFNFDVVGLSRLAMEELEKFRLCSYTEKSQRYITLDSDFVLPTEIKGSEFEVEFMVLIAKQAKLYEKLYEKLKTYVFAQNSELAADPKNTRLLEGWAKEDARYITSLSTSAQAGVTMNARNLENVLRRFASSPLLEVRELGQQLYSLVKDIAPSIVKYTKANDYDLNKYVDLKSVAEPFLAEESLFDDNTCKLINNSTEADNKLIAAFLYVSSGDDFSSSLAQAKKMSAEDKLTLIKAVNKDLNLYNSLVREYEFVNLTYDLVVSAACYGQLKRHRMASLSLQEYNPELGLTIPESIIAIGMAEEFVALAKEAETLYFKIKEKLPAAAPYALTNAHRRRVLMALNARELHHISRLREDAHSQWDIRYLVAEMTKQAKEKMPLTFALVGGKDKFVEISQSINT